MNLPFVPCEEAIDYILTSVELVGKGRWILFPQVSDKVMSETGWL